MSLFPNIRLPQLPPVKQGISWVGLLGENNSVMPESFRRQRWEQWKKLAGKQGAEYWSTTEGCIDERGTCRYLDGDWCTLQGLPASVNPYLTMKHGMIGMACMGLGFETKPREVQP